MTSVNPTIEQLVEKEVELAHLRAFWCEVHLPQKGEPPRPCPCCVAIHEHELREQAEAKK